MNEHDTVILDLFRKLFHKIQMVLVLHNQLSVYSGNETFSVIAPSQTIHYNSSNIGMICSPNVLYYFQCAITQIVLKIKLVFNLSAVPYQP